MDRRDVIGQNGNDGEHYDKIDKILDEREKTHGRFSDVAEINFSLVSVINEQLQLMIPTDFVSISMILHKISRIACGNPMFKDHWVDIAGYAKRAIEFREQNEPVCESIIGETFPLFNLDLFFPFSEKPIMLIIDVLDLITDICACYHDNIDVLDHYKEIYAVANKFAERCED